MFIPEDIGKDETTSNFIMQELMEAGYNMSGIRREHFFAMLGMTPLKKKSWGRNGICYYKESDWNSLRSNIVGRNKRGYPIIRRITQDGESIDVQLHKNIDVMNTILHMTEPYRPSATTDQKIDLLLWAVNSLLEHQAKYA